jgi:hypothetical protein
MTPTVYNISMCLGLALCAAGMAVIAGLGAALLTAGAGLIGLTAYSAYLASIGGGR